MSGPAPAVNFLQNVVKDDWTREVPVGYQGSDTEPWLDSDNSLPRVGPVRPLQAGILTGSGWKFALPAAAPSIPGALLKVNAAGDALDWSDAKPLYEPAGASVTPSDYYAADGTWKTIDVNNLLGYTPSDDSTVLHKEGAENILGVKSFIPPGSINAIQVRAGDGTGPMSGSTQNPGIVFRSVNNTVERAAIYVANTDTFTLQSLQGSNVTIASAINLSAVGAPVQVSSNTGLKVRNLGDTAGGPVSGGDFTADGTFKFGNSSLFPKQLANTGDSAFAVTDTASGRTILQVSDEAYIRGNYLGFGGSHLLGRTAVIDVGSTPGTYKFMKGDIATLAAISASDATLSGNLTLSDTTKSIIAGSASLRPGGSTAQWTVPDTLSLIGGNQSILFGGSGAYCQFRSNVAVAFKNQTGTADGPITALSLESPASYLMLRGKSGDVRIGPETGAAPSNAVSFQLTRTDGIPMLTHSVANTGVASISSYSELAITAGIGSSGRLQLNAPGAIGYIQLTQNGTVRQQINTDGTHTFYSTLNLQTGSATANRKLVEWLDDASGLWSINTGGSAANGMRVTQNGVADRLVLTATGLMIGSGTPVTPLEVKRDGTTLTSTDKSVIIARDSTGVYGLNIGYDTASGNGILAPIGSNGFSIWTHDGTTRAARLSVASSGAIAATNTVQISVPSGANGTTTYSLKVSNTSGVANGIGIAGYFEAANASVNYAIKTGLGTVSFGDKVDLNNNQIVNVGNMTLRGYGSSTGGMLDIGDYTSYANVGGNGPMIVFKGDDRGQVNSNACFAGIRGIKENATYLDQKGALVFYTNPTAGLDARNSDATALVEVARFGSDKSFTARGVVTVSNTQPAFTLQSSTNGSPKIEFTNTAGTQRLVMDSGRHLMLSDVTAGGPNRLFVQSIGNVGIGDFYDPYFPKAKLDVAGALSVGYLATETAPAVPATGLLVKGASTLIGNVTIGPTGFNLNPIVLNGTTSGIDYCNVTLGQWNLRSDNTGALKIGRFNGGSTNFTDDTLNVKNIAGVSNITTATWTGGSTSSLTLGGQYGFRADVLSTNALELWAMDTRQMIGIDRDTTRITVNPTSTTDFTSQLTLKVADASTKGQIIKLASVPTANALEVQGSASNVLSALTPSGGALFNGNVRISGSNRLVFGFDAGGADFYQSISGANDGNDLTYRTYNSHIFKVQAVDSVAGSGVAALTLNMDKSATFGGSVGLGASPAPYSGWNGRVLHVYDATTNLPHVHLQNTLKNALFGLDGGSVYVATDNASVKLEMNGALSRFNSAASQQIKYQIYDATSSAYQDMATYTATAGGGGSIAFAQPVTFSAGYTLQSTVDANELLIIKNAAATTTFSVTGEGTMYSAGITASFGGGSASATPGGLRYDKTPNGASLQSYGSKPLILNAAGNNVLIGTSTDDATNKLQVAGGGKFTGGATITGGGVTGTDGIKIGSFGGGTGGIWPAGVTPTNANFALLASASYTKISNPSLILFSTGGTNRWQISNGTGTDGNLYAVTDNTYDIGASGASRPRNLYVANSITLGASGQQPIIKEGGSHGIWIRDYSDTTNAPVKASQFESDFGLLIGPPYGATTHSIQGDGGNLTLYSSAQKLITLYGNSTNNLVSGVRIGRITSNSAPYYDGTTLVVAPQGTDLAGITSQGIASQTGPYYTAVNSSGGREFAVIPGGNMSLYNSYTDSANYESFQTTYSGGFWQVGSNKAGTGSQRMVRLLAGGTKVFDLNGDGTAYSWGGVSVFEPTGATIAGRIAGDYGNHLRAQQTAATGNAYYGVSSTSNTAGATFLTAAGANVIAITPSAVEHTPTWNNVATTFTALKVNATDTASAAGSKLVDLQVGSASKFSVGKTGIVTLANDVYHRTPDNFDRLYLATNSLNIYKSGVDTNSATVAHDFRDASNQTIFKMAGDKKATFTGTVNIGGTASTDVLLKRSANFTLAIRGGGDGADGDIVAGNGFFNTRAYIGSNKVVITPDYTRFVGPSSGYGAATYSIDTSYAGASKLVFNNAYGMVDMTASNYGFTMAVDKGKLLVNTVTDDGSGSVLQVAGAAKVSGDLTLTGVLTIPTATNHFTSDGKKRWYFDGSGTSYNYSGNTATAGIAHIWREAAGANLMYVRDNGNLNVTGNIDVGGAMTLGGVAANRWSSISGGTSKWETDYAGLFTFSQLQTAQYMQVMLKTAEGKTAGFTHYDVNNVTYGRLFDISSQPGVPIRISPAGTQAVQFATDGSSTFNNNVGVSGTIAATIAATSGYMLTLQNGSPSPTHTAKIGAGVYEHWYASEAKPRTRLGTGACGTVYDGLSFDIWGTGLATAGTGTMIFYTDSAGSYTEAFRYDSTKAVTMAGALTVTGTAKAAKLAVGAADQGIPLDIQGTASTAYTSAGLGLNHAASGMIYNIDSTAGSYAQLALVNRGSGAGWVRLISKSVGLSDSDFILNVQGNDILTVDGSAQKSTFAGSLNVAAIDYPGSTSAMTVGSSAFGFISPGAIAANKSGAGSSSAINIASQNLTIGYDGVNPFLETYDKTLKINATNHNAVSIGGAVSITSPGAAAALAITQSYAADGITVSTAAAGSGLKVTAASGQGTGVNVALTDATTNLFNGSTCGYIATVNTGYDAYQVIGFSADVTQSRNTAGTNGGRPIGVYAKATTTALAPVGYGVQAVAGSTRVTNFMATGILNQTGNLYEGVDSTGATVFKVAAGGTTTIQGNAASELLNIVRTSANPASIAFFTNTSQQQGRVGYNSLVNASYPMSIVGDQDLTRIGLIGYEVGIFTGGSTATRTQKWQFDQYGAFLATTDNANDIGASSSGRPRNLYVAGSGSFGGAVSVDSLSLPNNRSISLANTAGSAAAYINMSLTADDFQVYQGGSAGHMRIGMLSVANTGGELQIYTAGTKKVTVTAGGNVGINVTPSNATGMTSGQVLHIAATNNPHIRLQNTTSSGELVAYIGTAAGVVGTNTTHPMYLQTGNTFRWQIGTTGHFLANVDNAYDIGASAANRPKDLYLAGKATISGSGTGVVMIGGGADDGFSMLNVNGITRTTGLKSNGATNTLLLYGAYGGTSLGDATRLVANTRSAGVFSATAGTMNMVSVGSTLDSENAAWAPASGNATLNLVNIDQKINTSGTYAGVVRGVYFNPTIVASTGVTFRAFESTTGDVVIGGSGKLSVGGDTLTLNASTRLNRSALGALDLEVGDGSGTWQKALRALYAVGGVQVALAGQTPASPSTGWAASNYTPDKTLDGSTATLADVINTLGSILDRLKEIGIITA